MSHVRSPQSAGAVAPTCSPRLGKLGLSRCKEKLFTRGTASRRDPRGIQELTEKGGYCPNREGTTSVARAAGCGEPCPFTPQASRVRPRTTVKRRDVSRPGRCLESGRFLRHAGVSRKASVKKPSLAEELRSAFAFSRVLFALAASDLRGRAAQGHRACRPRCARRGRL